MIKGFNSYPPLKNKEWILDKLLSGMTRTEIAQEVGCTMYTLRCALLHHNLTPPLVIQRKK